MVEIIAKLDWAAAFMHSIYQMPRYQSMLRLGTDECDSSFARTVALPSDMTDTKWQWLSIGANCQEAIVFLSNILTVGRLGHGRATCTTSIALYGDTLGALDVKVGKNLRHIVFTKLFLVK